MPDDVDLGIDPALLNQHIAIDIGVDAIAERMAARPGIAAHCATFSRLVCDLNREEHSAGVFPIASDGHDYELHNFNRFSEGYGVVVNLVIPQSGTAWRIAVGDHYADWVKYLASSPTIPPGGMLALFTAWAEKNIPDPGQAQAAITAYEQYLKARPDSPIALSNLGAAYARAGRYEDAIEQYQRALKVQPDNLKLEIAKSAIAAVTTEEESVKA